MTTSPSSKHVKIYLQRSAENTATPKNLFSTWCLNLQFHLWCSNPKPISQTTDPNKKKTTFSKMRSRDCFTSNTTERQPATQTARRRGDGTHRQVTAGVHVVGDGLPLAPLVDLPKPPTGLPERDFSLQDVFLIVFGVLHLKHMVRLLVKHPVLPYRRQPMEPYEAHEEGTNISSEQLNVSSESDCGRFGEPLQRVSELRYYNEPEATASFQETGFFFFLKKKKKYKRPTSPPNNVTHQQQAFCTHAYHAPRVRDTAHFECILHIEVTIF